MSAMSGNRDQDHLGVAFLYTLQALPPGEIPVFEAHLSTCAECRQEIETLRPIIDSFISWPTDVLRPSTSLWKRLSQQISDEWGDEPISPPATIATKPEWNEVAEGISCKLLAGDAKTNRVTMLVRLAPGTDYPPHRHEDFEELHLLHGELMIDNHKLSAGDFFHAEPGSIDNRVWTETGCTCVLVTSTNDALL